MNSINLTDKLNKDFENGKRLLSNSHYSYDLELIDFLNIFNQVKGDFGNNLDLFLDLSMVLYNIGISKGYKLKTNEMKRSLKGIQ